MMLIFGAGQLQAEENSQVVPPEPYLPIPSAIQMKWHKAEYRMFIHFGLRTYYPNGSNEGTGREDPGVFNPMKLDAEQWVKACKAGGFDGIVLTTKHHRGFCLWQTDTTDHSVKSSPWKDGRGDVVKEVFDACRKNNITVGFYVSILDMNFLASGSKKYENYADMYHEQIKELSTRYGKIDEYWFDGFGSKKVRPDYKKIAELILEKQPEAVVYDSGRLSQYMPDRCLRWPENHGAVGADQEYRHSIGGKLCWYPNEPSIILQGQWFYAGRPMVKLATVKDYYMKSTGYGVTPLMNVPPNTDGLIDEASIQTLTAFKAWVDAIHTNDLARGANVKVKAAYVRGHTPKYAADKVNDGNFDTYYATDDNVKTATIEIDLGSVQKVNGFILQEYIPLGQRVSSYSIECFVDGKWQEVFSGKRIGYQRIILQGYADAADKTFPSTDRVRLNIRDSEACPLISTFQVVGKME